MSEKNKWNPTQYKKFERERSQPFYDLLNLVSPKKDMTIVDLGCGTGNLTKVLHEKFQAKHTLGIDTSEAMLKECTASAVAGLEFKLKDIANFAPQETYDCIFSNAALQWLTNHEELFANLSKHLSKQGQFAIQMPASFDLPMHRIARELASESPFEPFIPKKIVPNVLSIEQYSYLLHSLGFSKQLVRLQIYPHLLSSTEAVIDWVKGSLLTYYEAHLPEDLFQEFMQLYRERILAHFGSHTPFFLPFKRLLIWGEL